MRATAKVERSGFADPGRCRAILIDFLSQQMPGLWIPLADVREGTGWPADHGGGLVHLHTAVRAAERDGVVEFKSGAVSGRASVRLKTGATAENTR